MSRAIILVAVGAACLAATVAVSKQYTDYMPQKGVWEVNAIEVDPNHVDDYLTGLRKSQVPGFEVMKAHGIIDSYKFLVRNGYNKGAPSVLIMTHFISEEDGKIAVAGYEKYRTFIDDGLWSEITMAK
jgi:hypothetical protein